MISDNRNKTKSHCQITQKIFNIQVRESFFFLFLPRINGVDTKSLQVDGINQKTCNSVLHFTVALKINST